MALSSIAVLRHLHYSSNQRRCEYQRRSTVSAITWRNRATNISKCTNKKLKWPKYLIYWRGEYKVGYSKSFRQAEFLGALSATIASTHNQLDASQTYNSLLKSTSFQNAFTFDPTKRNGLDMNTSLNQASIYNDALQYMSLSDDCDDDINLQMFMTPQIMSDATKRCALIHAMYQVVATGMEYSDLVEQSINSRAFQHMMLRSNATTAQCQTTWGLFREEFSFAKDDNCPRFGKGGTIRSESKERNAILALKPLFKDFVGKVNLKKPDCPIYLLEGLRDDILLPTERDDDVLYKILAIRLESGAKHSIMAPNRRICKSTTPLDSTTAHMLCNIAMIRNEQTILDPFAGSAAILLAASLIASNAQTVGIEVASDDVLSREYIRRDFVSRGLTPPLAVLEGDAMNESTRDDARRLIGGKAFDVIITDPPYGRREGMSKFDGILPLSHLIDAIGCDRSSGNPLLKVGGRMVAFQPCRRGQNIYDLLPSPTQLERAGLELQDVREQRLSTGLSRWVLSFLSV